MRNPPRVGVRAKIKKDSVRKYATIAYTGVTENDEWRIKLVEPRLGRKICYLENTTNPERQIACWSTDLDIRPYCGFCKGDGHSEKQANPRICPGLK